MASIFFLILSISASLVASNDDITLESLMTTVQQQAATITTLQAQLASVQNTLQAQLASMQSTVQSHSADLAHAITALGAITSRLNSRVSFTAQMSSEPITLSNSPFLFDSVVNNVGNGYNHLTGVFTAPVAGDYIFYAKVMNLVNSDKVEWSIFKQAERLCNSHLTDNVAFYNIVSCFATVHLQKGDTVFVKRINTGTIILGNIWTSFSGQLISVDP